MTPFRQDLWDLPAWMYPIHWALTIVCGVLVVYGLWRRVRLWRMGLPAVRTDQPGQRIGGLLLYGLGQRRILAQAYPGLMHGLIFYSFVAFFVATSLVGIQMDAGALILKGSFYLVFEMLGNTFALLILIGLGLAAFRRYVWRPDRLNIKRDDAWILGMLTFIAMSGLTLEVMRLRGQQPPWASWSWLGNAIAKLFGPPPAEPPAIYPFVWWTHQLATFSLMVTMPYTKFRHIAIAPTNLFFRRLDPPGAIPKIENLEETQEPLGIGSIEQFSWKQLLDGDACTECGRCQAACPAYAAGQPLSPKKLVMALRDRMSEYPGALWAWQRPFVDKVPLLRQLALGKYEPALKALVGEVIADETLWSCTTCRACEQECPVFIEHVSEIVGMRRHLALEQGRLPDALAQALRNAERQGNPWGQPRHQRGQWAARLEVPLMADVGQADVLYWVGCAGSYDPRNQKVSQAVVRILHTAGVNFAVLGEEESCHAEWARRAGEEYLYQMQAQSNIETLSRYRFKQIVTQCPHCYNTLKNEYPQFGAKWQIMHHSQFIQELMAEGRLHFQRQHTVGADFVAAGSRRLVTFHDSCYLGRYNQIYRAPRQVLSGLAGYTLVEMKRSQKRSFCCGGGGACMWMEHAAGQRINDVRMTEIQALNPELVAASCPFCILMLMEAATARGAEGQVAVKDIAEIVAEAL